MTIDPKGIVVDIVGIEVGDHGRSCEEHEICGSVLRNDGRALVKGAAFYCSCFDHDCFAYRYHCQHCHKELFCSHLAQSNFLLLHASQSFPGAN